MDLSLKSSIVPVLPTVNKPYDWWCSNNSSLDESFEDANCTSFDSISSINSWIPISNVVDGPIETKTSIKDLNQLEPPKYEFYTVGKSWLFTFLIDNEESDIFEQPQEVVHFDTIKDDEKTKWVH